LTENVEWSPKMISPTDPCSAWTATLNGHWLLSHTLQLLQGDVRGHSLIVLLLL
jgi:hypothetical protein